MYLIFHNIFISLEVFSYLRTAGRLHQLAGVDRLENLFCEHFVFGHFHQEQVYIAGVWGSGKLIRVGKHFLLLASSSAILSAPPQHYYQYYQLLCNIISSSTILSAPPQYHQFLHNIIINIISSSAILSAPLQYYQLLCNISNNVIMISAPSQHQ